MIANLLEQSAGPKPKVAIVGTGAFGHALACAAKKSGNDVTLFGRKQLEDFTFFNMENSSGEQIGFDLNAFDLFLFAVPCQSLRSVCEWFNLCWIKYPSSVPKNVCILNAAKGIERGSLLLPHEVLNESLLSGDSINFHMGSLSGPSFAKELALGLPTSVVVATKSETLMQASEKLLHSKYFRIYRSNDCVGVDVAGALKNVIALVAGAVDGLGLGNNARAAVVTRGLGEMAQMGVKMGGFGMTFLGLSGLGDLILTCTGDLSRNRQFGLRLAKGETPAHIVESMGQVIEGVTTAESAFLLSQKLGLDTPILEIVYDVLYKNLPLRDAVSALANRESKGEFDWLKH
jgi:glycerol-3-phosphate dehydrogenase (NAD(P)+)